MRPGTDAVPLGKSRSSLLLGPRQPPAPEHGWGGRTPPRPPVLPPRALLAGPWVTAVGPLSPSQQSGSSPDLGGQSSWAMAGCVHAAARVNTAPSGVSSEMRPAAQGARLCGAARPASQSHLLALSPGLSLPGGALPFSPLGPLWAGTAPAFAPARPSSTETWLRDPAPGHVTHAHSPGSLEANSRGLLLPQERRQDHRAQQRAEGHPHGPVQAAGVPGRHRRDRVRQRPPGNQVHLREGEGQTGARQPRAGPEAGRPSLAVGPPGGARGTIQYGFVKRKQRPVIYTLPQMRENHMGLSDHPTRLGAAQGQRPASGFPGAETCAARPTPVGQQRGRGKGPGAPSEAAGSVPWATGVSRMWSAVPCPWAGHPSSRRRSALPSPLGLLGPGFLACSHRWTDTHVSTS